MKNANIVVDFNRMRCGNCKVAFKYSQSTHCRACKAKFERVVSNHVGLASQLEAKRNGMKNTIDVKIEPEDKYPELVSS